MEVLDRLVLKHAIASKAIRKWTTDVEAANWKSSLDIKKSFNSVDYVGNGRYVFDIKGNDFRLVAVVVFVAGSIYMRWAGTHSEYDKIRDCSKL